MKIVCNKDECARLVRECAEKRIRKLCDGCLFSLFCAQEGDAMYDEIMVRVEDICDLEAGG